VFMAPELALHGSSIRWGGGSQCDSYCGCLMAVVAHLLQLVMHLLSQGTAACFTTVHARLRLLLQGHKSRWSGRVILYDRPASCLHKRDLG
jgi:hypothetical protein